MMSSPKAFMKRTKFHWIILLLLMMTILCVSPFTGFSVAEDIPTDPPSDPIDPAPDPEPEPEPVPIQPSIVLGFGDSITVGYPYITSEGNGQRIGGYEPTLEAYLNSAGGSWQVLNYGVFGQTTMEGLSRIDSVVSGYSGAYILILEGTNDVWSGISYNTTVYNLGVMVDKSRNAGLTPVLATLTPDERPAAVFYKNIPNTYNPAIRRLATDKSVLLCDQYSALILDWANLSYDELHPNTQGYQVMGNAWYQTLAGAASPSPSEPENGGGDGGGGCFIATAAFGSPLEPHVQLLKRFRDRVLLTSSSGKAFVNWYYENSPPLAHVIAERGYLKTLVRWMLTPVIAIVWLIMRHGLMPALLECLGFLIVAGCVFTQMTAMSRRRKHLAVL
jgi:lysophospholipase L1-like esterase